MEDEVYELQFGRYFGKGKVRFGLPWMRIRMGKQLWIITPVTSSERRRTCTKWVIRDGKD
jgi:hypothetical protein